jgi:glycosyltransferase involved in cell wall biosynthesis
MAKFFPLEERGFRQDCVLRPDNRAALPADFPLGLRRVRGRPNLLDHLSLRSLRTLAKSGRWAAEYIHGLEPLLADYGLVRSAEIHYPFSWQCVRAHRRGQGPPVVVTVHQNIPHIWLKKSRIQDELAEVRRCARLFVAVTEYCARLCRQEGIPAERIRVGGNAVDLARFRPGPLNGELRRKLGAGEGDFLVLALGRQRWEKGQWVLVHALRALELAGKPIRGAIVGSGGARSALERLAAVYGLGERLRFLDPLPYEGVPELLRAVDCLVQPSLPAPHWQEQFGMAALEALACGVPVVTTRVGGIPEVVGEAALYTSPGNYVALAEALERLRTEPGLREELVGRGLERAELFSQERIAARYAAAFAAAAAAG